MSTWKKDGIGVAKSHGDGFDNIQFGTTTRGHISIFAFIGTYGSQIFPSSYTIIFDEFVYYQSLGEVFPVGDFNAHTISHQGQDLQLEDNVINLLEFPRSHWLRESDDSAHFNALCRFLAENVSFSGFIILCGVDM